jgi:bacterial/archaeal transporter family-2 protein
VNLLYLLLAAAAGAMLPVQAGVNAQLARFVGGPVRASFVSFLVGTIALLLLSIALIASKPLPSGSKLGGAPWWVWVGGLLGAFYVVGVIASAPRLGAVALIAAVIAGQTACSVLADQFGWVGFREHSATPGRLAGLALVFAGVALVRIF